MKINAQTKSATQQVDLSELIYQFSQQYRNVFAHIIGKETFIYRTLGRKEYYSLLENEEITDMEKEEVICTLCVLWPEEYDLDNCSAGVPTELTKIILKNSFLDGKEGMDAILGVYRQEMYDLQNQITCMINEAFPEFSIEDIEEWDMERTAKYLSRAEWKLINLRGLDALEPEGYHGVYPEQGAPQEESALQTEELFPDERPAQKLDNEKLRELQQKYPEIDWAGDSVAAHGLDALKNKVDTTAGPLRTDL